MITAHGELDRTELPALRVAIQNVLDQSAPALILDMAEVTYIDSSVLAALIAESLDADRRGKTLVVATGAGGIMRSLELKGLVQVMHIADSVDAAAADLAPPS